MQTLNHIVSFVAQYGYLVVFLGVMLESTGLPLPGETVLLVSGALAHQGVLDLGDAVVFGVLGAVVGDQIGYWVGRKGGRGVVLRWGRYVLITPERLMRAELFFAHHGGKAVFLVRFVAGLRAFGALVAGMSRMHWSTFFLYNALGGTVWGTASVLAGYLLWRSVGLAEHWLGGAFILLAALLALVLLLYRSYRGIARPEPSDETDRRSDVHYETTANSGRIVVKAIALSALVVILVAVVVGAYLGEWPWAWDLTNLSGWLLELS